MNVDQAKTELRRCAAEALALLPGAEKTLEMLYANVNAQRALINGLQATIKAYKALEDLK